MSISHLYYCGQEINLIGQLVKLNNSDFFKRGISRYLFIRLDDFIKIARKVNNASIKNPLIKRELNDLAGMYDLFAKIQRDKMGAHFQWLDYFEQMSGWSEINLDKVVFFQQAVTRIYPMFATITDYLPLSSTDISSEDQELIEEINREFNFENHPSFSSDLFVHTRPNSGGLLPQPGLQTKAATLKSIELLLAYETKVAGAVASLSIKGIYQKLLTVDIVSYADNFITRAIPTDSAQFENGLDHYLKGPNHPKTEIIITSFINAYKFTEKLDVLRQLRNQIAGHLDTTIAVIDIKEIVEKQDLEELNRINNKLQSTFKKLCLTEIGLSIFLINPFDRHQDVVGFLTDETPTFNGQPAPPYIHLPENYDNQQDYVLQWEAYLAGATKQAGKFFHRAFSYSQELEQVKVENIHSSNHIVYENYSYRKAHRFFTEKLLSPKTTNIEKIEISRLFISAKSGYPGILAFFLTEHIAKEEFEVKLQYLIAISHLTEYPAPKVLELFADLTSESNLFGQCELMKAVLRIDSGKRLNVMNSPAWEDNEYSKFILARLLDQTPISRLYLCLAMYSELVHNPPPIALKTREWRRVFFTNQISDSPNNIMEISSSITHKALKDKIMDLVKLNRVASTIAAIAEHFSEINLETNSEILYELVKNNIILVSPNNDVTELHNTAVIYFRGNDTETAIEICNYLLSNHPDYPDANELLLSIYLSDEKYKIAFEQLKLHYLNDYSLSAEHRVKVESMDY